MRFHEIRKLFRRTRPDDLAALFAPAAALRFRTKNLHRAYERDECCRSRLWHNTKCVLEPVTCPKETLAISAGEAQKSIDEQSEAVWNIQALACTME